MQAVRTLYVAMDRLSRRFTKVLEWIAALLIALCTAALLFQVLYRFVIVKFVSFSFPFTEEFARYALIWAAYLSIGICLKEGSHAVVNLIFDRLSGQNRLALYHVTRIIMLVFLYVAIRYGVQVAQNNIIFKSSTLRLPGIFLYSAPVVGCLWMLYETLTEWLGVLCGELEPFNAGVKRGAEHG